MSLLFKPAEITSAYLKMALMGFQGSGKTYTATSTAIGLVQLMDQLKHPVGNKPIFFLDTEKGSDWIKPRIEKAGLSLYTAKTRAFTDLLAAVPQAQQHASLLLIDSLTHFWTELCDTYCRRKAEQYHIAQYRLQFQDWAYLKGEWRKFTDLFVNSDLHIIVCGRAGYEYDFIEDQDTKKKQLEKTGIKFKAEGEMGYEPDLLVLMERRMDMTTKADEHVAHVVKDRSTLLDGKEFSDPTFENFLPHIKCLNLGGQHLGIDTSRTSIAMIPNDTKDNRATHRKIVLGEIEQLLAIHIPGQAAADKKKRAELLRTHFKGAWEEMESLMPLDALRRGYDTMTFSLEGVWSRYHTEILAGERGASFDDLPDHSKGAAETKAPVKLDRADRNGIPGFLQRTPAKAAPIAMAGW